MGKVMLLDREVAGAELLDKFETIGKNHPKLVHSYVMDALETANPFLKWNAANSIRDFFRTGDLRK